MKVDEAENERAAVVRFLRKHADEIGAAEGWNGVVGDATTFANSRTASWLKTLAGAIEIGNHLKA